MKKMIILGGGIAGLLAAYVLRKFKPLLVEAGPKLGGNYTAGGLKYIRLTNAFEQLLLELGIPWIQHKPAGALWWGGETYEHPEYLRSVNSMRREAIQLAHWLKTRGIAQADKLRPDCMNDPLGNGADVAMQCDHTEMLRRLETAARNDGSLLLTNSKVEFITEKTITVSSGLGSHSVVPYDVLIPTLPLGLLSKMAPWAGLPTPAARPLTIATIRAEPRSQLKWDYMYTPTLPNISRIVWQMIGGFQAEMPGDWRKLALGPSAEQLAVHRDILELQLSEEVKPIIGINRVTDLIVIPGHLEPLDQLPSWPANWHPLGRFAEWEPRATAERVLDRILRISSEIRSSDWTA